MGPPAAGSCSCRAPTRPGGPYAPAPARARRVRLPAGEPAVRHLVVTTGDAGLLGYSSHRDLADLHAFTSRVFARLGGTARVETALLMRTCKRAGAAERA
ncbi:hypothetical protein ACFVHW_22635 [Streptomyces sp. NPDC127110]|uniref:hypothetical protein n=1 Tax=Streptomyces sp. NPDC127110 TaxID=3345362 RepID=UPI003634A833